MILSTKRLILRPWAESDAEELFPLASSPAVGPAAGWPVHTSAEHSREIIQTVLSAPGTFAIVLKETNRLIGSIGLKMGNATDLTDAEDECELGYWLGTEYWGRGIMPEAAQEALRYAFEELGMKKVWCGYYDGNSKSKRVQEKCGFQYEWTTEGVDVPLLGEKRTGHVNSLSKDQWQTRK